MEDKKVINRNLEICTYEDRFETFRKKNGLTKKRTWDLLRAEIQVNAWADAYEGMQEDLDSNSPEDDEE